jgi:hypothetical protein
MCLAHTKPTKKCVWLTNIFNVQLFLAIYTYLSALKKINFLNRSLNSILSKRLNML